MVKRYLILGVSLALIAGGFWMYERDQLQPQPISGERHAAPPAEDVSGSEEAAPETGENDAGEEEAFAPEAFIAAAISQWSSLRPQLAQSASGPIRFWFSSSTEAYAEYGPSESSVQGMIFIVVEQEGEEIVLARESSYAIGETDWVLEEGVEVRFTKPQNELYEKNKEGEWVKRN